MYSTNKLMEKELKRLVIDGSKLPTDIKQIVELGFVDYKGKSILSALKGRLGGAEVAPSLKGLRGQIFDTCFEAFVNDIHFDCDTNGSNLGIALLAVGKLFGSVQLIDNDRKLTALVSFDAKFTEHVRLKLYQQSIDNPYVEELEEFREEGMLEVDVSYWKKFLLDFDLEELAAM